MAKAKAKANRRARAARRGPNGDDRAARFSVSYPDAGALIAAGPFLRAVFMTPEVVIESRPAAAVHGALLADTGASSTCIAEDVAQELGLRAIDSKETYGAAGLHVSKVYFARLEIHIKSPDESILHQLALETQMTGIPRLGEHYSRFKGAPRLIGLLGRDLMQHCKIVYDGPKHVVTYEFDPNTFKTTPQNK